MDLRTEMQNNGLIPDELTLDNKFHRFKADPRDDKKSAWYIGHEVPLRSDSRKMFVIASYGNWKTGEHYTYQNKGRFSPEDKKAIEIETKRHDLEMEKRNAEERARACERAEELVYGWRKATWLPEYLKKKKVASLWGALPCIDELGECLLVPMVDIDGKLCNVQRIYGKEKKFLKGGKKKSCFHVLTDGDGPIYIAEGFATAATIAEAVEGTVVCAFDAGNLKAVASEFRMKFKDTPIVICADNDESGVGQEKASEAKEAVLGQLRVCPEVGKDFNDIGVEATREFLNEGKPEAPSKSEIVIAGFTKINSFDSARAMAACEGKILFDSLRGSWYRYDTVWRRTQEDDIHKYFMRAMDRTMPDGWAMRDYEPFFKITRRRLARTQEWNEQRNLIPFKNGVLNLDTMELFPHKFDDFFNWCLPYNYDPTAQCPTVERFLDQLSAGDPRIKDVLVAYLSAIIRGCSDLQRYLELVGLPGTGKSTYISMAAELVGAENCITSTMGSLESRFETAGFFGKRLIMFQDAESYSRAEGVFKSITGQDKIRYEEKNKQIGESFVYRGMVLVGANNPIHFDDKSTAIARRRVTIHIDHVIEKVEEDLFEKIRSELTGVVNLALSIPKEFIKSILNESTRADSQSRNRSLIDTNVVAAWIDESCVLDPIATSKTGFKKKRLDGSFEEAETHLYPNFLRWCERSGRKETSLKNFSNTLKELAMTQKWKVEKTRNMYGVHWKGIRVIKEGEDVDSPFGKTQ
jgi:P4 family phage/plasmid primase-like protien